MYYIGLDVHKKTISYCVKDVSGGIQQQGTIPATRTNLDRWMKTLPQPWTVAMETTIFTRWIYDHLLPHAAQVKVAHLLMLRAITVSQKNDRIDAGKIAVARKMVNYILTVDRAGWPFVPVENFSTAAAQRRQRKFRQERHQRGR
jgi:Transposase